MNYSIPAYLSNFSTLEDQRTIAKLKVFYVGETEDGRVFTKEFSEELIKSIAFTPVVAFYSDLADDFIGHNNKQYIYGIVKPDAENGFETDENGIEWFNTEVMLYTDRIDNIGEVAKKIVGHKQSLEMDPNSVEYDLVKENGKTKVYFKKARLCGLSVLGENQKPAFKGSEFFTENEDLQERFENFFSFLNNKDRGALMNNKEIIAQYANFIKLTYNDKEKLVWEYAKDQFGEMCFVAVKEMDDNYVVLEIYNCEDGKESYKKYDYIIDDNGVSLSNERICYRRYLSAEEIDKLDVANNFVKDEEEQKQDEFAGCGDKKKDCEKQDEFAGCGDKDKEKDCEEQDFAGCGDKKKDCEDPMDDKDDPEDKEDNKEEEDDTVCVKEKEKCNSAFTKEGVDNEQETNLQEEEVKENFAASSTQLNNSEREELEAYRFKERLNLVESYKDELPAETITSFVEIAKTSTYQELEAKLAIEFRKFSKMNKNNNAAVFSFNNIINSNNVNANTISSYADLVKATLNK